MTWGALTPASQGTCCGGLFPLLESKGYLAPKAA